MDKIEQRIEQIEKFASQCYYDGERYSAFIAGSIWADNNPPQDIVNLNNVWHDASEEPQGDNWKILCVDDFDLCWVEKRANVLGLHNNWDEHTAVFGVKMWAYIDNLLPKQLGNSKQEKGGER